MNVAVVCFMLCLAMRGLILRTRGCGVVMIMGSVGEIDRQTEIDRAQKVFGDRKDLGQIEERGLVRIEERR